MNLKIGEEINGFILNIKEDIDDINSTGYIFKHKKSGANLMYIENDDDNKVFFISFKTPPEDDCGTPHIIEHSVLCGSDKYPVKDPFNELAKGSLNTYLNALTYSDKTVYPVASRNDKDFKNLIDVYMDAVFKPLILKNKEIFMQEGHHLHMENLDAPLEIKGVVYNEMKGAFSDPDRYLDGAVNTALFPDSPYRFESGGDPDKIPDLTYEKFKDFYKKYYHPSNSYIYLFGDMDIEEKLAYLDREYLSDFDVQTFDNEIKHQKSLDRTIRKKENYPVVTKTDMDGMYAAGFVTGDSCDEENSLACSILSYILMDTNASPLRKALTESGFCSDTEGWYDSSMLDTVFMITAKNAKEDSEAEFENIVMGELEKCANNGLNKELVQSAVNAFEFMLSEENFGYKPRGLYYGLKSMNSWLHKENPFESFRFKKHIQSIRLKAENGMFENLIKEKMIENPTKVFVCLNAVEGMQAEIDEKEKRKLEEYKASLSDVQREEIVNDTKHLLEYQSASEDLSVMPYLLIDDIDKNADIIESKNIDGTFYLPAKTNGIIYNELLFNVDHIPENDYGYLGLLCDMIGKLDTEKYGFNELPTKIDMYTGGITASCNAYFGVDSKIRRAINVSVKALEQNVDKMLEIIDETVNKMIFDKQDSIKLIVKDRVSKLENYLMQNGHMAASSRALSHINPAYKFKDDTAGISYFKFLRNIDVNFDNSISEKLKKLVKIIFNKNNVIVGISCEQEDFSKASRVKELFNINDEISEEIDRSENNIVSEGIITPGKVQYAAKAADYKKAGYEYSGKMLVLKNIIDLEYLWNTVRVQGGAYGCGCNFLRSGSMYMYSYRDPNLSSTLNIYDKSAEFIKDFDADEKAMTGYIIGAINSIDRPLNKEQKLKTAVIRYINGISQELIQKERDEVLSTTAADIRNFDNMLSEFKNSRNICVIGNGDNINKEKDVFESIITMK